MCVSTIHSLMATHHSSSVLNVVPDTMFWKVWRMSNLEKMDKETNRILDILAENELSTAENIAVVTKVLIILLKIEELNSMTEEEKQIVQKAREKIAFYITRGGVD